MHPIEDFDLNDYGRIGIVDSTRDHPFGSFPSRSGRVIAILLFSLLVAGLPAMSAPVGVIYGRVLDQTTGEPFMSRSSTC